MKQIAPCLALIFLLSSPAFAQKATSCRITQDGNLEIIFDNNSVLHSCVPPLPAPVEDQVHQEVSGKVIFLALAYTLRTTVDGATWFTDDKYLRAEPNANKRIEDVSGPHVSYKIQFTEAGTKFVFIKGYGLSGEDDSVHFGINGEKIGTMDFWGVHQVGYNNKTNEQQPAKIEIPSPGIYTFDVWMREDGFLFEEILLTKDQTLRP